MKEMNSNGMIVERTVGYRNQAGPFRVAVIDPVGEEALEGWCETQREAERQIKVFVRAHLWARRAQ